MKLNFENLSEPQLPAFKNTVIGQIDQNKIWRLLHIQSQKIS